MSTISRGFLSAFGHALDVCCRPISRRVDAQVAQLVEARLSAELEARLVPTLSAALDATAQSLSRLDALMEQTNRSTRETDETLNLLIEEVNRLREQVDAIQQSFAADNQADGHAPLAVVDRDGACDDDYDDEAVAKRARVG